MRLLPVEAVRSRIPAVDVPEQAFKLGDLLVGRVRMNLEDGKVCPELRFLAPVGAEAGADPCLGEAHVDYVEHLTCAAMPEESLDAASAAQKGVSMLFRDVLREAHDQAIASQRHQATRPLSICSLVLVFAQHRG